jgi:F420H(2)-dependent quinone reductase
VAVGYVDEPDGSILVAAGDRADWALNLDADPNVDVEVGDRQFTAVAERLSPADHAVAIRGLILRYGTPAERLGRGPSFRLRPVAAERDVRAT